MMKLSASQPTSSIAPDHVDSARGPWQETPRCAALLYREADLQPVAAPQRGGVPQLVNELCAAGSAASRERIIRRRLDEMGFDWMGYGRITAAAHGGLQHAYLTTYTQAAWSQRYFGQQYYEVDPRLLEPSRSSLPLVWDIRDLQANVSTRQASARTQRFVEDFFDSGIHSGIFLRIATPAPVGAPGGGQVVVSLMSNLSNRRWIGDRVLGEALTFGLSLHEFLSQHVQLPLVGASAAADLPLAATREPSLAGLPAMQQEVLRHVVHGLTDKEIADRMHVSSHTVDYHLRQLRQRFAARNRVQLVNAATRIVVPA
jgi:DNA-binding CsgD family transcriptional regulator